MRPLALLLLLSGCPPPPPSCFVPSAPPMAAPLLVEGATSLRLAVSGPACRLGDALSALPTLKDPGGVVVPVTVSKLEQQDWSIDIELTTPPLSAGTYELRMFVEPTIAFVDLQVLVARDGVGSVVKTRFPRPCLEPARTHAGTTFCRSEQGFSAFTDAGEQTFPQATSVAVTRNAVWMMNGSALSRLEDHGAGQLVVTGTQALLSADLKLTTSDEQTAFIGGARFDASPDGGLRLSLSQFATMLVLDGPRVVQLREQGWCDEQTCEFGSNQLIAVDDEALWFAAPTTSTLPITLPIKRPGEVGALEHWSRPLKPGDGGMTGSIPVPPAYQPLVRTFPFRITGAAPLLLFSLPDAGVTNVVVLRQGPSGTTATAFPEHAIVDATREWLFTPGDNANELKAYPLTP